MTWLLRESLRGDLNKRDICIYIVLKGREREGGRQQCADESKKEKGREARQQWRDREKREAHG